MALDVQIYTLSTCGHCKSTKKFLDACAVQYDFTDVDLLDGEERTAILEDVKRWMKRQLGVLEKEDKKKGSTPTPTAKVEKPEQKKNVAINDNDSFKSKANGRTYTVAQLKEAGYSEEKIKELIEEGSLEPQK